MIVEHLKVLIQKEDLFSFFTFNSNNANRFLSTVERKGKVLGSNRNASVRGGER